MAILCDVKGIVDLLSRGWTWVQERRDPVRAPAHRMIYAFEAPGILRKMQAGRIFASQGRERIGKFWYPEELASGVADALVSG